MVTDCQLTNKLGGALNAEKCDVLCPGVLYRPDTGANVLPYRGVGFSAVFAFFREERSEKDLEPFVHRLQSVWRAATSR